MAGVQFFLFKNYLSPFSNMSFQISYEILTSEKNATSLDTFLQDVIAFTREAEGKGAMLAKMAFFLNTSCTEQFRQTKAQIDSTLTSQLKDKAPPTVFIAQSPLAGLPCAVEMTLVSSGSQGAGIRFKSLSPFKYAVVEEGDARWLFLGLDNHHLPENNFNALVFNTFDVANKILEAENMSFKNVIRQWNYIENITNTTQNQSGEYQYYQIFNDTRALFYENSQLRFDFPAATGIGCDTGGFALELIALSSPDLFKSISIKSPVQKNAYEYSDGVLIGDAIHPVARQAPLFERAKMVMYKNSAIVYVSGTAAISGEKSVETRDPEHQTELTIQNIFELVTETNLRLNNIHRKVKTMSPSYVRAYVKNKDHNDLVDKICKKHFAGTPLLLVQSDVCRDELLVEIEAAFHCQFISQ